MGVTTFLSADLHLGHRAMVEIIDDNTGMKLRPWETTEEMDEALIARWNAVVRPTDRVYLLGDVVMNRRALPTIGRLNGDKVLVKGNHDVFRLDEYTPYFRDVRGCQVFDDMILTHIPIHPDQLGRYKRNVHGHLHTGYIDDERYLCISVERTAFQPISIEQVREFFRHTEQATVAI